MGGGGVGLFEREGGDRRRCRLSANAPMVAPERCNTIPQHAPSNKSRTSTFDLRFRCDGTFAKHITHIVRICVALRRLSKLAHNTCWASSKHLHTLYKAVCENLRPVNMTTRICFKRALSPSPPQPLPAQPLPRASRPDAGLGSAHRRWRVHRTRRLRHRLHLHHLHCPPIPHPHSRPGTNRSRCPRPSPRTAR